MSDLETAIGAALEKHGGWASGLQLRDMLPNGMPRGEAFDLTLTRMTQGKRLEMRAVGGAVMFRLRADSSEPSTLAPIAAPGPASAVTSAFHPPAPPMRIPLSRGVDEVNAPNPNSVSHAKRKEKSMAPSKDSAEDRILKLLASRSLTTSAIADSLKMSGNHASTTLRLLAKAGKIGKPKGGNLRSPWILPNGKGPASPTSSSAGSPARATTRRKPAKVRRHKGARAASPAVTRPASAVAPAQVQDLELKLQVLERHAASAGKVSAFVLREIREDLQRLAA